MTSVLLSTGSDFPFLFLITTITSVTTVATISRRMEEETAPIIITLGGVGVEKEVGEGSV